MSDIQHPVTSPVIQVGVSPGVMLELKLMSTDKGEVLDMRKFVGLPAGQWYPMQHGVRVPSHLLSSIISGLQSIQRSQDDHHST